MGQDINKVSVQPYLRYSRTLVKNKKGLTTNVMR